jgi:hypothetical protein
MRLDVWSQMLLVATAFLLHGCRTQREQVIVMGDDVRPKEVADPRLPITTPGSLQSRLVIQDLSTPMDLINGSRIELILYEIPSRTAGEKFEDYVLGTPVTIKPLKLYSLEINAFHDEILVASNLFCTGLLTFKAQYGTNSITASLCAAPDPPTKPRSDP